MDRRLQVEKGVMEELETDKTSSIFLKTRHEEEKRKGTPP